jgi:hypothetical protein
VKSVVKRAVIQVLLVDESTERMNKEIEDEIIEELSRNLHLIPWAAEIEKVRVTSS